MDFLSNPNLNNVAALATAATKVLVVDGASNTVKTNTPAQIVAGIDGDKGDITVSASGATWTIDNDVVTYAKMQNVSATSRVLGRKTANSGDTEECTLSEVLDFVGSAAQGDILYRNATTWTRLGAGTSGQYLKTQGTGANPVWASVTAASAYRADFTVIDYTGYSGGITSAVNGSAFQDSTDYVVYCTEFNPTNFALGFWCVNASGNNAGNVGFDLQYTTSNPPTSGWTTVSGSTLNANGSSSSFKRVTSTVSIAGSPTAVFWRVRWVNTTGSDATFSIKNFYFSLWN